VSEKRMLIVPAELTKKINDNRGDMSQAEFISFLIDGQLKEETQEQKYVTKEEIRSFEQDIRKLLRNFLEFFVGYGLEMGKQSPKDGLEVGEQSPKADFEELTSKLQGLEEDLASEAKGGKATIKWK
jgi:hypothetical protein